jgi:hypothetical protein
MNWFRQKKSKEPQRYYLLPGQGGEGYRRKRRQMIFWSVIMGLVFSGLLTFLFFYLNRPIH